MRIGHPSGRESSRGAWPWRPKQALLPPPAPHTPPGCPGRGSAAWAEKLWFLGYLGRTVFFVGSSPKLSKAPIWGRDSHTEPPHQARSHTDALTVSPSPSSPLLSWAMNNGSDASDRCTRTAAAPGMASDLVSGGEFLADAGSASPPALSAPVRGGSRAQQQGREVHVLRPHLEDNVDLGTPEQLHQGMRKAASAPEELCALQGWLLPLPGCLVCTDGCFYPVSPPCTLCHQARGSEAQPFRKAL